MDVSRYNTDDGALPVRCAGAMMAGAGQPSPRSMSGAVFTGFAGASDSPATSATGNS
ncbi:hypothetical protein HaLaN_20781, partial [Haematococcus lacustris]